MLEVGQWATPVPAAAMRPISSRSMNTPWANQTSGPAQPRSSA